MKVLFVTPFISTTGGGVSEVVKLLSEVVRARGGAETEVWAFETPDPPHKLSSKVRLFKAWMTRRFGISPGMFLALLRSDADVVHVHGIWMFHVAAVYFAALLTGKPFVVTPHGMLEPWILARSRKLKAAVSGLYQNAFLRRARTVQALTEREALDIGRFLPGLNVKVVPNYVDSQTLAEGQRPAWWRGDFEGRTIFLFLARINEKKGYRELIAAWNALCEEDPRFREQSVLVFCGWIDGAEDFRDLVAAAARMHGNVIYGDAQFGEAKVRSLNSADFVVLPSHSEGLPMTVLEAWAVGKPVLMTDACNLPIGFERRAALELNLEPRRLAQTLREATAMTPDERQSIGDNARALVQTQFSPERIVNELMQVYADAIGRKGGPASGYS